MFWLKLTTFRLSVLRKRECSAKHRQPTTELAKTVFSRFVFVNDPKSVVNRQWKRDVIRNHNLTSSSDLRRADPSQTDEYLSRLKAFSHRYASRFKRTVKGTDPSPFLSYMIVFELFSFAIYESREWQVFRFKCWEKHTLFELSAVRARRSHMTTFKYTHVHTAGPIVRTRACRYKRVRDDDNDHHRSQSFLLNTQVVVFYANAARSRETCKLRATYHPSNDLIT